MEHAATLQHPSRHCRDLPWGQRHRDNLLHHPGHLSPCLEASWVLGRPMGAPARGGPTSSQRGREGCQMLGLHRWGGQRLGGVWRRWRRCWRRGPLGTACLPVGPLGLAPHWAACGQRLLRASSCAGAPGWTTQLTPATPRPPRPVGPPRPLPRWRDDLPHALPGFFPPRAFVPSPGHVPQNTGRPIPPHHGPSWGRVRGNRLLPSGVQRIACHDRLQPRRRQGAQAAGFLPPRRRSGPRSRRCLLTLSSRGAALSPPPAVRAARPGTTRARGVGNGAMGGGRKKTVPRGHKGTGAEGRHLAWERSAGPRCFSRDKRDIVWGAMSSAPPRDTARPLRKSMPLHRRGV